jgi:rSAM/selenodomain-associated transferase 2
MNISIIIPTYNEERNIEALIPFLQKYADNKIAEIIVCDGGSKDETLKVAANTGIETVTCPVKGRASQMNLGATIANGDILYFIHADTFPPKNFVNDIYKALEEGYALGRYKTKFISDKPLLRINEWFTQFDLFICMGGDQTLFVQKLLFKQLGGFKEEMELMEEYEFCHRARIHGRYKIMNGTAFVSARKYEKNGWFKVQKANYKIVQLYKKGATQKTLIEAYDRMLKG